MSKVRPQISWAPILLGLSALVSFSAAGQQAAAPGGTESASPAAAGTGGLEEIVVTSRKRPETLVQTPVSITALTATQIQSANINDLVDLSNFTPGFEFENQTINRNDRSFAEYSIRGMYPNSAFSGRGNVQILIDGSALLGGHVPGFEDVASVEVVRGPQSAYFGRSSFAGAVSFTTRNPYFDFGGDIDANFYSYGGRDISESVNIPVVNDKLAIRLSGREYHTDGQYANALQPGQKLGEQNTDAGAITALLTPTDNLSIKLYVTGWNDDDGPSASVIYRSPQYNCDTYHGAGPNPGLNYFCGSLPGTPSFPYGDNAFPPGVGNILLHNSDNLVTLDSGKLDHQGLGRVAFEGHLNVQYTFDSGYILTVVGAYDRDDFEVSDDLILQPLGAGQGLWFRADESDRDANAEIHLTSPASDDLKWLIGADYYRVRTTNITIGYLQDVGALQFNDENLDNSDTYSIFGSASYEIYDKLTLSVEGRAQWDDIYAAELGGGSANAAEFRSFTPRIILSYALDPKSDVYFSYARGNRPGEFNSMLTGLDPRTLAEFEGVTGAKVAVPEETVDMYELGAKGLFFEDKLRVLADIYYGEWDNQHLQQNGTVFDYATGTNMTYSADVAVGETLLYGLEMEVEYHPIKELSIRGTYDIANTDIRKYVCLTCVSLTGFNSAIGNRLPDTPKYQGTLSATYEAPVWNEIRGFVRGDLIFRGNEYESEANLASTGEATLVNFHLGVETDKWRAEIYGNNVLNDKHLLELAYDTDFYTGKNTISASLANKPVFGIRGSYHF
jgi:iron complex outermembrane receptor protein